MSDPLLHYLERPRRRAYTAVVRHHYLAVWNVAYRLTGNSEDAADVAQDVFLRLLADPPVPKSVESPRAWLAWRVFARVNRLRRAAERRRAREEEHARQLASVEGPTVDLGAIHESLSLLSEEDRAVLELHYLAGLSSAEIAPLLGVGERAVRARIARAREALRRRAAPHLLAPVLLPAFGSPEPSASFLATLLRLPEAAPALLKAAGTGLVPSVGSAVVVGGLVMTAKQISIAVGASALVLGSVALSLWLGNGNEPSGRKAGEPAGRVAVVEETSGGRRAGPAGNDVVSPAPDRARDLLEVELSNGPPSIRGRVLDPRDAPIAGADIRAIDRERWENIVREALFDPPDRGDARSGSGIDPRLASVRERLVALLSAAPRATTDPEGEFRFRDLPERSFRLFVMHPDWLPERATVVSVGAGAPAEAEIHLAPAGAIAGRVLDGDGNPIRDAVVEVHPSRLPARGGLERWGIVLARWLDGDVEASGDGARTLPDGRFVAASLAPEPHDVSVHHPRYLPAVRAGLLPGGPEERIVLASGAQLAGRIVDAVGEPVAGARVRLRSSREREVHRLFLGAAAFPTDEAFVAGDGQMVASGDDGRFRFAGIGVGPWLVDVARDGFATLERHLEPITVPVLDLGDVPLEPPGRIEGRVVDENGSAVAGARVWIERASHFVAPSNSIGRSSDAEVLSESSSDRRGRFVLDGSPAEPSDVHAAASDRVASVARDVEAGTNDLEIVLRPGHTVKGRVVRDENGEPIAGAVIRVASDPGHAVESDARGRFELRGLALEDTNRGSVILKVDAKGLDSEWRSIPLLALREGEVEFRLSVADRVRGHVLDSSGRGVSGAHVALEIRGLDAHVWGYQVDAVHWTISEPSGEFELAIPSSFRALAVPVEIGVTATHSGYARARVSFDTIPSSGEAWPEVDLVLEGGATLRGRVRGDDGMPVSGARVALSPEPDGGSERSAWSAADGSFEIPNVASGRARVTTEKEGYARSVETIDVLPAGGETEIVLEREATIEGRVVDPDGAPVGGAEVLAFAEEIGTTQGSSSEFQRRMLRLLTPSPWRTISRGDGTFHLSRLASEQRYTLVARRAGYEGAVLEPELPGGPPRELVIARYSALAGRVLAAESRRPILDFQVDVIDVGARSREQAAAADGFTDPRQGSVGSLVFHDPKGFFFFDGLPPGKYEVAIVAPGRIYSAVDVTVGAGEERDLEVLLSRGSSIDVLVVEEGTDRPVADALVAAVLQDFGNVYWGSQDAEQFVTDADGRVRVSGLKEGRYGIGASHPYYRAGSEGFAMIDIAPGADPPAVKLSIEPAGRLEIRVRGIEQELNADGAKSHYVLLLEPTEDGRGSENVSDGYDPLAGGIHLDPRGRSTVNSAPPGRYAARLERRRVRPGRSVSIGPTGGIQALDSLGEPESIALPPIEIRAGETTDVDLRIPEGF